MIIFKNISNGKPYKIFYEKYKKAVKANQSSIEAISISSYCISTNEVDCRLVNLKYVINNEFIFFSNYNSAKASQFKKHNQITAVLFWNNINTQIRIKAKIKKTNKKFSDHYFSQRDKYKNVLAISSSQSQHAPSYEFITNNYESILANESLTKRPNYWGGYKFKPYYFEFWEGHKSRINKREVYELKNNHWNSYYLQP